MPIRDCIVVTVRHSSCLKQKQDAQGEKQHLHARQDGMQLWQQLKIALVPLLLKLVVHAYAGFALHTKPHVIASARGSCDNAVQVHCGSIL